MLSGKSLRLGPLALNNNEEPIERQILDYLADNPAAQDTVEGIVEWWLLRQKIVRTTSGVEAALAKLISEGKLTAHRGPQGRTYYRLSEAGRKAP
jgi:DNA-binding PadR family transcriptional regulator